MVHLFGSVSSPTCANFALRKTADDNNEQFDPDTISTVKRNFYVDDYLKSSQNEQAAITTAQQLRILLSKGGFRLTKWLSNSRRVIESIPESERSKLVKEIRFGELPTERALGYYGTSNRTLSDSRSCHQCMIHLGLQRHSFCWRKKSFRICVE